MLISLPVFFAEFFGSDFCFTSCGTMSRLSFSSLNLPGPVARRASADARGVLVVSGEQIVFDVGLALDLGYAVRIGGKLFRAMGPASSKS